MAPDIEPPADDELALAKDLGFPAAAFAMKPEFTAPRHVLVPEAPDRLAWLRPAGWGLVIGAVEGVVAHPDTIPRDVTGGRVRSRSLFVQTFALVNVR